MPLKTDSHVSFRHPDINVLKVAAKPARSRARPSRGVEQRQSGRTTKKRSLLGEAHSSRGAPSARAWLSLVEWRSWEPPVAAMNGEAEQGRAELRLLSEPTLITAFHCALHLIVARRTVAGGGVGCPFEFDEADLISKSALRPPALCILKANELEREPTQDCAQTKARACLHASARPCTPLLVG